MTSASDTPGTPWYRHPWMWLVVGLPLASVIASLTTVAIAVKNKDDLVRDDWYKAGRAINQDLGAEQHARVLGLKAEAILEPAVPAISVTITGSDDLPDRLQLVLVHSTIAQEDMTAMLERQSANSWRGTLPRLPMGKRHLMLEPVSLQAGETVWRLRANDVIFQGSPVELLPAG
jgi:hypothetical protein